MINDNWNMPGLAPVKAIGSCFAPYRMDFFSIFTILLIVKGSKLVLSLA